MENELAFNSLENCMTVAKTLIEEDYVVMLSREDQFYILNYQWSENGDRNDVVFVPQEEFYRMMREEEDDKYNVLFSDDITFCGEQCDLKSCRRNSENIRDNTIPHSFSVGRPSDCPKLFESCVRGE